MSANHPPPLEILHPGGLELTRRSLELCAAAPGARLLDLGCGCGAGLQYLHAQPGFAAFGIDLGCEALRRGVAASPGLRLACAQAQELPLAAASVDILLAECSLSTMGDLNAVLAECRRALRPGGRLAVSDLYRRGPAPAGPAGAPARFAGMPNREGWTDRLEAHGFDVLVWEDHTPALTAMAAQAIFAGRSLGALWGCSRAAGAEDLAADLALVSGLRLGYFLTVAKLEAP